MRLRIADRILVALAGLLLIACCAGIIAQMFFNVDLVGIAAQVFSSPSAKVRAALIALSLFLFILGLYCLFVLFRHRRRKDKFILQKNESGELAISLKALENMVNKCLEQHSEIHVQNLYMENQKDGLLIRLRGNVAGGISIPLTVEALQRQIKQYVTACSGVEVKGIRVQIEASEKDAKDAPFAIEGPAPKPLLKEENGNAYEPSAEAEPVAAPAPVSEAAAPAASQEAPAEPEARPAEAPVQEPIKAEVPAAEIVPPAEDDDDRPLHQRLFKAKTEPCIIPVPPEEAPAEERGPAEPVSGEEEVSPEEPEAENPETEEVPEEQTEASAAETEEEAEAKRAARDTFAEHQNVFDQFVTGDKPREEKKDEG